jgi:hypothetical protein
MFATLNLRKFALGLALTFTSTLAGTTASAALIDIDFSPGNGPAQVGAAVFGSAGDIWNNLTANSATTLALNDVAGNPTAVNITYSMNFGGSNAAGSAMDAATTNLMTDYGAFNGKRIVIAGLAPSTAYQLALYGAGDQNALNGAANGGQGTTFTILPSAQALTTGVNTGTPTLGDRKISDGAGVAYVLLAATSSAAGILNVDVTYNSTSFSTAPVNGFQLQTVPEPTTLGAIAAGVAVFIRRRRSV